MATMRDPLFLAEAANQRLEVTPITGQEIEQFVTDAYATPQPIIDRARALVTAR